VLRRRLDEGFGVKAQRLLGHFLRQPGEFPRWCGDRFLSNQPIERQLPWFSWGAIAWLERWLRPQHRVLEFGAGGSTLFFAARTAEVVAVERDPVWRARVAARAGDRVRLCEAAPETPADLVVVDGPDWAERPAQFRWAQRHLRPGGVVVLDDSWLYPELAPAAALRFAGIGPCRLGVTETLVWPAPEA